MTTYRDAALLTASIIGSVLLAVLIWLSWPLSIWLIGSLAAAFIMFGISIALETGQSQPKRRFLPATIALASSNLSGALLFAAVGIALACAIQAALQVQGVSIDDALKIENALRPLQESLGAALQTKVILIALVLIVLASLVSPSPILFTSFNAMRTWLSRIYIIVVALLSFSAFTIISAEEAMYNAKAQIARELVALAWTADAFTQLNPGQVQHVRDEIIASRDNIPKISERLVAQAPRLIGRAVQSPLSPRGFNTIEDMDIPEKKPIAPHTDQPKLNKLSPSKIADLKLARMAAIEAVTEIISNIIGDISKSKELIKKLVEEVSGSIAKYTLQAIAPNTVDLADAKKWIANNIHADTPSDIARPVRKWALAPPDPDDAMEKLNLQVSGDDLTKKIKLELSKFDSTKFDPTKLDIKLDPNLTRPRPPSTIWHRYVVRPVAKFGGRVGGVISLVTAPLKLACSSIGLRC